MFRRLLVHGSAVEGDLDVCDLRVHRRQCDPLSRLTLLAVRMEHGRRRNVSTVE